MKNILITGSKGFIGRNLAQNLNQYENYNVLEYNSHNSNEELMVLCKMADLIVHTAGVNRTSDKEEFYKGNTSLTEKITNILTEIGYQKPIIYTSSIQVHLDNDYGKSKLEAEKLLLEFGKLNNTKVEILRLPNVFGKWSKPNYNSVIATWCYNLSRNKSIVINDSNKTINLIYIDNVIEIIMKHIEAKDISSENLIGNTTLNTTLGNVAEILTHIKNNRTSLELGNFNDILYKNLYTTYLSYLPEDQFKYGLKTNEDNRGTLAEIIKSDYFGQIFVSTTNPGVTRGNHWHHSKVEKFIVIQGDALISLRELGSNKVIECIVKGSNREVVDIPPGYTHSIKNIGVGELITLFWANEIFNPNKADTFMLDVKEELL